MARMMDYAAEPVHDVTPLLDPEASEAACRPGAYVFLLERRPRLDETFRGRHAGERRCGSGFSVRSRGARVGSLGEGGGVRMGLHHGMVGGALDHVLQLGDDMAGRYHESPGVAAHRLVCRAMKRDQPVAAELSALTAKRDDSIPASTGDRLVELAKSDLVERDAPRADVIHALVGQSVESVRRSSRGDFPRPHGTALTPMLLFSAAQP
jgi:hypothetical protein